MQPDTQRCALCDCTIYRVRRFIGARPRNVVYVALCDVCNRQVVREATAMQLPRRFPRLPTFAPAPPAVLVEIARELSVAVRG